MPLKGFEEEIEAGVTAGIGHYFKGCKPIEITAEIGEKSLAFGPIRPAGLTNHRTGRWPYAVVQLCQDNLSADLNNLVGFKTNLLFSEQAHGFRLIPGLESASFERYDQMYRNSCIASPLLLKVHMEFQKKPGHFAAGQLSGIEGYAGNIASGLITGINASRFIRGLGSLECLKTTMTGSLIH